MNLDKLPARETKYAKLKIVNPNKNGTDHFKSNVDIVIE